MIKLENLIGGYRNCPIINGVNLEIQKGEFFALLGPNGSGKSTLFKLITGQLPVMDGKINLGGKDISAFSKLEKAKKMAVLTQEAQVSFDYTIEEIVSLGRYPHQKGLLKQLTKADWNVIEEVMEITNIGQYRKTPFRMISGGEKQRVLLAKALAQEPEILLLDEPTNHLDIKHTLQMLDLLKERQRSMELTIFAILHDLNIASLYADRVALLHTGSFLEVGDVGTLRKVDRLKEVYEVELSSQSHPTLPKPQLLMTPEFPVSGQPIGFEDSYRIEQTEECLYVQFDQPLRTISNGMAGDGIQWLNHFCHFSVSEKVADSLMGVNLPEKFAKHSIPSEQAYGMEMLIEPELSVIIRDEIEGIQMLAAVSIGKIATDGMFSEPTGEDLSFSYDSINLMLFVDAHLTDGSLITALMAATEAKVKALRDLTYEGYSCTNEDSQGPDSILLGVTQMEQKGTNPETKTVIGKVVSQFTYHAVQEAVIAFVRRNQKESVSQSESILC